MDLDIIIYAVIAIIILARLWTVFGRRSEEDRERPNPFVAPPRPKGGEDESFASAQPRELPALLRPVPAAPASLAGGLEQIKVLDPSFDEKQFLQGARQAFTMIVEDFAKGDLARSTPFLGAEVLRHFQNALELRRQNGQTMENKIARIKDAETAAAKADGTNISITVRFVSDQQNILRDAGGKVIGGAEGKIEEVTDVWTFARDTKSSDPNWQLVETRS